MTRVDRPLFTQVWDDETVFRPAEGASYVFAASEEERGRIEAQWRADRRSLAFIEITSQAAWGFSVRRDGAPEFSLPSRGARLIRESLFSDGSDLPVYIDITGMSYTSWIPLVRACIESGRTLRVVYTEPIDYARSPTPTEGEIYDLSERIEGVRAIPGFARLATVPASKVCLVPFLGFEGTRFAYIRENVQLPDDNILPVVGVPGFRPEFPFAAYLGNRLPLLEARSWRRVRFARANCPFSAYYVLEDLHAEYPDNRLKIAPIGTKPHGLGAVLFALRNESCVELVYDHPIRKAGRTRGKARVLVYNVSEFLA